VCPSSTSWVCSRRIRRLQRLSLTGCQNLGCYKSSRLLTNLKVEIAKENPFSLIRDLHEQVCLSWAQILKHTALNSKQEIGILIALPHTHRITRNPLLSYFFTMHFPLMLERNGRSFKGQKSQSCFTWTSASCSLPHCQSDTGCQTLLKWRV
jgi:hypothetical protein